jgi:hypothetical protein
VGQAILPAAGIQPALLVNPTEPPKRRPPKTHNPQKTSKLVDREGFEPS